MSEQVPECTAVNWFTITGRAGRGVVISLDQLPEKSAIGDQLSIDGQLYRVDGVERPDMNGYRGLLVLAAGGPIVRVPRLRDVLAKHQPYGLEPGWAENVAAAWREACTIRTVKDLDALPDGAVIRWDRGPGIEAQVFERYDDDWLEPGNDLSEPYGPHLLPALLVWHPDWEAS